MKQQLALILALMLTGWVVNACRASAPVDASIGASMAGDLTLVASACETTAPGSGVDVCRVHAGAPIVEDWVLVVPWTGDSDWGEVHVRYRDRDASFPVTAATLRIPWATLTGAKTWAKELESPAQARASIRYKAKDGPRFVDLLGFAVPVVLSPGYDPLPLDSTGVADVTMDCRVAYTSAGRSAVACHP